MNEHLQSFTTDAPEKQVSTHHDHRILPSYRQPRLVQGDRSKDNSQRARATNFPSTGIKRADEEIHSSQYRLVQANGMVRVANRHSAEIVPLHTTWLAKRTVGKTASVLTSNTTVSARQRTDTGDHSILIVCHNYAQRSGSSKSTADNSRISSKYSRKQTEHNYFH